MKRADLNGKTHYRATPTNFITPDIFHDIWMQTEHTTSGVQIVELRSSESGKSANDSLEDDKDYFPIPHQFPDSSQWSCSKQNIEDDYRRNEAARERRRLNLNNGRPNDFPPHTSNCEDGYVFAEVYVSGARLPPPENVIFNQKNCFTIHDNHLLNSDTSEEEFADVEVINMNRNETNQNWAYGSNSYDDNVRYDQGDQEDKPTVWIYSFKNRNILTENDFELVNIPSQECSTITNSSGDDFQQSKIEDNLNRASSPIPTYIPRLNLPTTPPLPTLTEVTEPGRKQSNNDIAESPIKSFGLKENNWCTSEPSTSKPKVNQSDTSTSIVNWMALSPREKRRKIRYASPINLSSDLTGRLATVHEEIILKEKKEESKAEILVDLLTKGDEESCQCGGDCASHVATEYHDESESYDVTVSSNRNSLTEDKSGQSTKSGVQMDTPLNSTNISIRTTTIHKVVDFSDGLVNTEEPLHREYSTSRDIAVQTQIDAPKDRGDHIPMMKTVPRIKISNKIDSRIVSGPMENIESNNWIHEEPLIKDDRVEIPRDAKGDRASESLWMRHMALLKPSAWAAYEEVFDQQSIPSLQLSMNTDSIEENQTFFKRLTRFLSCLWDTESTIDLMTLESELFNRLKSSRPLTDMVGYN
ncbi:hypothetical protein NE865_00609 [Phthorimaea operculella]|nr:hypothetical protein NE865_00609 [Phthorimaea operculella]